MNSAKSTILIPTYNRSDYLSRLLQFMVANFNPELVKVVVLDGSDKEASKNKELCLKTGIEYRYYGPEIPILERWLAGIRSTETEFVSFLADDDILQPDGYYDCLNFLQSYPQYSIAHGNYVWFLEQNEQTLLYPGYQTFSIEHESSLERLFYFLADYIPITYGVYRTDILRTAYEETISNLALDNLHFTELLSGCIPVLLGKVKKLATNYYGRNMGDSSPRPVMIYPKLVFAEDFSYRYGQIKSTLKNILNDNINPEIAEDALDYCFGAYYGKILNRANVTQHFTRLLDSAINSG